MKVIVDEDLASKTFLKALRSRFGEGAVAVLDKGLSDSDVWEVAQLDRRTILTQNAKDFGPLAETTSERAGLLLVSRHADREMLGPDPRGAKSTAPNPTADRLGTLPARFAASGTEIVARYSYIWTPTDPGPARDHEGRRTRRRPAGRIRKHRRLAHITPGGGSRSPRA